jgi:hypothetical protein
MYDLKWDHLLRFQKIQNMDYESLKPDLADGKKIILNMGESHCIGCKSIA